MPRGVKNKGTDLAGENWDKGIGGSHNSRPVSVKLPPDIEAIVRSLPDRSERLRQWITEGMQKDGLI